MKIGNTRGIIIALGLTMVCLGDLRSATAIDARSLVLSSIEAMGGEAQLHSLHSLSLKGIGHRYMLEQSERPEGPWLLDYFQFSEERDFDHGRVRRETLSRGCDSTECWKSAAWSSSTLIVNEGVAAVLNEEKSSAAPAGLVQTAEETLVLSPGRALLSALAAPDLRRDPDVSFHGFTHHVVSFTGEKGSMRILVSSYSNLPSAIEISRLRPYEVYWSPWGDVTTRVSYAFWMLEKGGMHFPREWSFETNGKPDWVFMINELTLNPPLKSEDFHISEDTKKEFLARKVRIADWPLGLPSNSPKELAPGVFLVPGRWNVLEIRQQDGIVILEAPISNQYSRLVIEDAQKRFPGLPIKGVITTSDAWPHIGGLREYAARGIPIYALDLNRTILESLFSAPHNITPDTLSLHPKAAHVLYVSERISVGSGRNALELIPMRTATGERQMMVYLRESKLLYSSDAFQRGGSGEFFLPQTLSEVVEVAQRENLDIETDVGMHLAPTPWAEITKVVASILSGAVPG